MLQQTARLEQALQYWEDLCFVARINAFARRARRLPVDYPITGPLLHWSGFRNHLLTCRATHFDAAKYLGHNDLLKCLGSSSYVPTSLWSWSLHSRRVYHITEELSALLDATSLNDLTWADVTWPFPSFAVTLERPIIDPTGRKFDCIVVTSQNFPCAGSAEGPYDYGPKNGGLLQFLMLSDSIAARRPLSQGARAQLEQQLLRRQWGPLQRGLDVATSGLYTTGPVTHFHLNQEVVDTSSIKTSATDLAVQSYKKLGVGSPLGPGEQIEEWNSATRIVIGLLMYLSSLPSQSPHVSDWVPPQRGTADPSAIYDGMEVCHVRSTHTLTTTERAVVDNGRTGRELAAHWRKGYWRRPLGKGNDPTAEKTVWIKPVLVREDRLEDGALPGGATTILR